MYTRHDTCKLTHLGNLEGQKVTIVGGKMWKTGGTNHLPALEFSRFELVPHVTLRSCLILYDADGYYHSLLFRVAEINEKLHSKDLARHPWC